MADAAWLLGAAGAALFVAAAALSHRPRSARPAAWRNRVATLSGVAALVFGSHAAFSDPQQRAGYQYLFTITLGYGHLLGAVVFSRQRLARLAGPDLPPRSFAAFVGVSVLSLFAAYTWVLGVQESLFIPLLAVSVWHTVENDLALDRAYAERLRLGPMPRAADHHLLSVGAAALLVLLAGMTQSWLQYSPALEGTLFGQLGTASVRATCVVCGIALVVQHRLVVRGLLGVLLVAGGLGVSVELFGWLRLADLFVVTTLYHLISWLIFFADRARSLSDQGDRAGAALLWRRLAWVHLPPALLCAGLLWPAQGLDAVRFAVFSPAIYLFWSMLHVVQTALVRGLASSPRGPRRSAAAR